MASKPIDFDISKLAIYFRIDAIIYLGNNVRNFIG